MKQPQGSDESIREISPRPKIASAFKTNNAINSTDAKASSLSLNSIMLFFIVKLLI